MLIFKFLLWVFVYTISVVWKRATLSILMYFIVFTWAMSSKLFYVVIGVCSNFLLIVLLIIILLRATNTVLSWLLLTFRIKNSHLICSKLIWRWTVCLTYIFHLKFTIFKMLNSWYSLAWGRLIIDRWVFLKLNWFIRY